ncbi:hypothetical protein ZIOFF_069118 [Zingiber officinale]|uniref:Uncharacterized protein n=1 Tax=Zingiber officinale TaxID=94328 RepID=A0A8J5CBB3_ZINOF|nr:hypothetical protein ZIOFF_069118 [Zingiber officinale]
MAPVDGVGLTVHDFHESRNKLATSFLSLATFFAQAHKPNHVEFFLFFPQHSAAMFPFPPPLRPPHLRCSRERPPRHHVPFAFRYPRALAWDPTARHFLVGSRLSPVVVSSVSDAGVIETLVSDPFSLFSRRLPHSP